ncbi:MAG: hypothetical protein WHS38_07520 [Thermodesulforhabdaceae bacterium]
MDLEGFFDQVCSTPQHKWWIPVPRSIQEILIALSLSVPSSRAVPKPSAPYIQRLGRRLMLCEDNDSCIFELPKRSLDELQNSALRLISLGLEVIYLEQAKCPLAADPPSGFDGIFLFTKNAKLLPSLPAPRVAFFQSRTPRRIRPYCDWLQAFIYALNVSLKVSPTYVSSSGTLGYDIITTWFMDYLRKNPKSGSIPPFIMVHSKPLPLNFDKPDGEVPPFVEVSCSLGPASCHRWQFPACRDFIVAAISSHIVAIKLRSGGILSRLLTFQPEIASKPKAFWIGSIKSVVNSIRKDMVHQVSTPESSNVFWDVPSDWKSRTTFEANRPVVPPKQVKLVERQVDWFRYLYHYTRGSMGPMNGQTSIEYVKKLISMDPLAGNEAIDVLINIAREGRLRASQGMQEKPIVRGGIQVVCWTSVPPVNIHLLKRWNKALIRWTVEPYGIAVLKTVLKKLGTKPVCYLPPEAFNRLSEFDKYRFQKHKHPGSTWKHEREWRIPSDVQISSLKQDEAFWFVDKLDDALKFTTFVSTRFPIYVLEHNKFLFV